MEFELNPQVESYLHELVPERPAEMQAMEAYAKENRFPIIGPVVGNLCYQIALATRATRIFELGSGYGYSTAWFARAVQELGGGEVYHTVWDEELSRRARRHIRALGYEGVVQYRVGESIQALRETPGPFDLIFNDIDKQGYPESLPVIEDKLRSGGVLIIDNMLMRGKIFDATDRSAATEGVREFTRRITASPDWVVSLIPIRDGVILAYKR